MLSKVNILENPNEYYQKLVSKNSSKKTPLSCFGIRVIDRVIPTSIMLALYFFKVN